MTTKKDIEFQSSIRRKNPYSPSSGGRLALAPPRGGDIRGRRGRYTVPDPMMSTLRKKGDYIRPAEEQDIELPQEQFSKVISEGHFKYLDDRILSMAIGFVDEFTITLADDIAGAMDGASNYLKRKWKGEKLTPEEENNLLGYVETFKKKTMGEFPTTAAAGRFLAMASPFVWASRWAQGVWGLAGFIGATIGFKKYTRFTNAIEEIGKKTDWIDESKIIEAAVKEVKLTDFQKSVFIKLRKANEVAPRITAGLYGAATGAGEEILDSAARGEGFNPLTLGSGVAAIFGGGAKIIGDVHKKAHYRGEGEGTRAIVEKSVKARKNINLSKKASDQLRKYAKNSQHKNADDYMDPLRREVESLHNESDALKDLALGSLVNTKKTILIDDVLQTIYKSQLEKLKPFLSPRDLKIKQVILESKGNLQEAKRLFKEYDITFKEYAPEWKAPKRKQEGLLDEDSIADEIDRVNETIVNMFTSGSNQQIGQFLDGSDKVIHNLLNYDIPHKYPDLSTLTAAERRRYEVDVAAYKDSDDVTGAINPKISEAELKSELQVIKSNADFGTPLVEESGPANLSYFKAQNGILFHDISKILGEPTRAPRIKPDSLEAIQYGTQKTVKNENYNPIYAENMKKDSAIRDILYGSGRSGEPGMMEVFKLNEKWVDGKRKIVFIDAKESGKTMEDILFQDVGKPGSRELHGLGKGEFQKGVQLGSAWKLKRAAKKGDAPARVMRDPLTGSTYVLDEISDKMNPNLRAFAKFLNHQGDIGISDTRAMVKEIREAIVSGAIENPHTLSGLVKKMQGQGIKILNEVDPEALIELQKKAKGELNLQIALSVLGGGLGAIRDFFGEGYGSGSGLGTFAGGALGLIAAFGTRYLKNKHFRIRQLKREVTVEGDIKDVVEFADTIAKYRKAWKAGDTKTINIILGGAGFRSAERAAVYERIMNAKNKKGRNIIDNIFAGGQLYRGALAVKPFSLFESTVKEHTALDEKIAKKEEIVKSREEAAELRSRGEGEVDFFNQLGRPTEKVDFFKPLKVDEGRAPQSLPLDETPKGLWEEENTLKSLEKPLQSDPGILEFDTPEDSDSQGPPDARGEILEPEEDVITEETEEEVIDPELDDRERRKKRIFSFLKKQGANIGKKSVV